MSKTFKIALIEDSEIVAQGIILLLTKTGRPFQIIHYLDLSTFLQKQKVINFNAVIVNPSLILNLKTIWNDFTDKYPNIIRIALIYNYYSNNIKSLFNHWYKIDRPISELVQILIKVEQTNIKSDKKENLTKREKEVLRYLSQGKSIKEIAEIVHLSHFTVLTHRKNISSKTGIKTIAGLTVYAISLGLISIDEMSL